MREPRKRQQAAAAARNNVAPVERSTNLMEMPLDEFQGALAELAQQGVDTDALLRQYRAANSPFAAVNRAAEASSAELAAAGRRPVAGTAGLLSRPIDDAGGVRFEPAAGLLGMLAGAGRQIDAPMAAYQELIPAEDMDLEALGTAGVATLGGGAVTRPSGSFGMGGRVAGETKPQRIARLLREGRQSEVTDDLLGSLTPDENAALFRLYDEGATGMNLPMDEASRLARAGEMGFGDQLYYHGSDNPSITAFDPSMGAERLPATFLSDSRRVASTYGDDVGEYFARSDNPAEFYFDGKSSTYFNNESLSPAGLVRRVKDATDDAARYGSEVDTDLAFDLQSAGVDPMFADTIDAVKMRNVVDDFGWGGSPANNIAVFDPSNIRSRTARFDPRLTANANLLAANASPEAGLLSAAAARTPAEQMARRILDMRAAGRAGEVTDEMMAQADPQYMFNNTPLPMDEASRMVRADAAGFMDNYETYHGGGDDIQAFRTSIRPDGEGGMTNVGVYSAYRPQIAETYAPNVNGGNIIPLATRATFDDVVVDAGGANWNQIGMDAPVQRGGSTRPLADAFSGAEDVTGLARTNTIAREAVRDGAGSLRINNTLDIGGYYDPQAGFNHIGPHDVRTDFYPRNIRSRFARFDPEFAHLSNLNAANIDPLSGLFGAMAAEEQRRRRNAP